MLDWEWYNIIPARVSLIASTLVVLHIIFLYYLNHLNLKPFHITSLLLCILDIFQDIGYAIPLSCYYAVGFLLYGCLCKAFIIPGFIYYLYQLISYSHLNKSTVFYHFIIYCQISLCVSILFLFILSIYSDYFHHLCDDSRHDTNNFTNHMTSAVGYNIENLLFLFLIILPCSIGYLIFSYFIILIITKLGYDNISQISLEMKYRFTYGLLIFTIGMIPGIYITILYIFNIRSDQIFIQAIKISGVCLCSLGFLYGIFYLMNVLPLGFSRTLLTSQAFPSSTTTHSTTRTATTSTPATAAATARSRSQSNKQLTFGELINQPVLSEPIFQNNFYRFSSSISTPLIQSTAATSASASLTSQSISSAPSFTHDSNSSPRQSELPLMKLSFHDNQNV